ncbi:hypothetical protein BH23ACT10_BH23ACT10_07130 [soil metagenome]
MSSRLKGTGRRAGWGVADQALSSLTNFAVGVFIARELGPAVFGAFSLMFATYLVVLNASRGMATDPLVVRFSDVSAASWRRACRAATMTSLLIGAVAGACCLLASLALDGQTGRAFTSLSVVLPGLMLQDAWRYAFFAARRGHAAFINDLAWAVLLVPFLALALANSSGDVRWFIIAWGGAATLAGLVGALQARLLPRIGLVGDWMRSNRDLGLRYVAENISFSAATQLRLYGVGVIAGLAGVGALRGAELLVGPINLLIMGLGGLMAVPEASRLAAKSMRAFTRFVVGIGIVLATASTMWGALVGLVLPDAAGRALMGSTWQPAVSLLLPTTVMIALFGVWTSAWTGIRALGAARRGLRAQIIGALLYLGGALVGAVLDGVEGAAWGSAAGNLLAACVWWRELALAIGEHPYAANSAMPEPVPSTGI